MAKRLVLACMDRRLNMYLDEHYNDGNTLFLRNAGANAHCLLQSISDAVISGTVNKIVVLGHTDCGAMKVVFDAIVNCNSSYCADIKDKIVHPFDDYGYLKEAGKKLSALSQEGRARAEEKARRVLEKRNVELQVSFLKELTRSFPNVCVEGSVVDISTIKMPSSGHGNHAVIFARECSSKFNDMCNIAHTDPYETYIIEAGNLKEALTDLQMAVDVLHIHDVKLVAPDPATKNTMASDLELAKSMSSGFLKGSNISVV